jgi:hypothetical protein
MRARAPHNPPRFIQSCGARGRAVHGGVACRSPAKFRFSDWVPVGFWGRLWMWRQLLFRTRALSLICPGVGDGLDLVLVVALWSSNYSRFLGGGISRRGGIACFGMAFEVVEYDFR